MSSSTWNFTGRNVLVTGGTSGIGAEVAAAFADAGAVVTVTGTRSGPEEYGDHVKGFAYRQLNLQDPRSVDEVAGSIERLDILINNAGVNLPGGASEWDPDVFEQVIASNLTGPFRLTGRLRRLLQASEHDGGAAVVNSASMTSFFGLGMVPAYGAAKAGVVQMTKTMAVTWAEKGIRVNAVAPGLVETGMTAPMLEYDDAVQPVLARTPARRVGTPRDIAPAVLFLASPEARYITGHTLIVDGGFSVQG